MKHCFVVCFQPLCKNIFGLESTLCVEEFRDLLVAMANVQWSVVDGQSAVINVRVEWSVVYGQSLVISGS